MVYFERLVSIRYIAVLGFQPGLFITTNAHCTVSIRYIAVLGFQRPPKKLSKSWMINVSIRYIAVLGFQLFIYWVAWVFMLGFDPLYRGTWFPTNMQ